MSVYNEWVWLTLYFQIRTTRRKPDDIYNNSVGGPKTEQIYKKAGTMFRFSTQ